MVILLAAPQIATCGAYLLYRVMQSWVRGCTAPFDQAAGAWLTGEARARGIPVEVIASHKSSSFFRGSSEIIHLRRQDYFGLSAWSHAIAAHELGHALDHHGARWTRALGWTAWVGDSLIGIAWATVLGSWLVGAPGAMSAAQLGWNAGALLGLAALAGELRASLHAMRALRRRRLTSGQVREARLSLAAAFSTHAANRLGTLFVALQWSRVAELVGGGPGSVGATAAITSATAVVAAVAGCLASASAAVELVRRIRADDDEPPRVLRAAAVGLAMAVFMLLARDASAEAWYGWAFLLACVGLHRFARKIVIVAVVVVLVPLSGPIYRAVDDDGGPLAETSQAVLERGALRLESMSEQARDSALTGFLRLRGALYLPLVVAFWVLFFSQ